jgi:2,3-diaminopropionate biosynthesis protein SbnB
MHDDAMLVLSGAEVKQLLIGQEAEMIALVKSAYESHREGRSSLPHSTFLRFPAAPANRIIALPAYLDHEMGGAGVKWVSSFPANITAGLDRASAVIILNSTETGRPIALLEGSVISAKRTAASAALAAHTLHCDRAVESVAVIGCGLINFEIQGFLRRLFPSLDKLFLYDLSAARAEQFASACKEQHRGVRTEVVPDLQSLLRSSQLVSIATTAAQPYLSDLSGLAPGSTILHISLRDLSPEIILACDNIVDDVDHVCRAQTSLHLAEQMSGSRRFIRCTLADVTQGTAPARRDRESITAFSPFGLGVLDIAVSQFVYQRALGQQVGTVLKGFFPSPWQDSSNDRRPTPAPIETAG